MRPLPTFPAVLLIASFGSAGLLAAQPASSSRPSTAQAATADSAAAPAEAERPTYRLAYRFAKDQVIRYEVVHHMEITTHKDQTTETATNESKAWKHIRVLDVDDDGAATLELTIDKVKMSARFGNADPVIFDSQQPGDVPPQFRGVKESVGTPHGRVKVDRTGRVLSVVRLVGNDAPGGDDQSADVLVVFPDRPLEIGETWKEDPVQTVRVSVSRTLTRNVEIVRKYQLVSVIGDLATIDVKSLVLTPVHDPSMRAQLIQRAPDGTIVFDRQAGQIVSRRVEVDKTEVGVFGDNSSMRAISDRLERLVDAEKLAQQPKSTKSQTSQD